MGYDISISEARDAYVNYYYKNNTDRVDEGMIRYIESRYATDIPGWKAAYESTDSNKYVISDDDASKANKQGAKDIKKASGFNGNIDGKAKGNMATSMTLGLASAGMGAVSAVGTFTSSIGISGAHVAGHIVNTSGKMLGKAAASGTQGAISGTAKCSNALVSAGESVTKGVGDVAGTAGGVCFMVGCVMALATGLTYKLTKPNSKETEALVQMGAYMQTTQEEIAQSEEALAELAQRIEDQVALAEEKNEALRDTIKEQVASNDINKSQIEAYNAKKESGEGLTQEEVDNYKILVKEQSKVTTNITEAEEGTQGEVEEIYDGIGESQEEYDAVGMEIENSMGQVEEAASVDNDVKTACIVESVSQGLNVASSAVSAAEAIAYAASGSWAFGITAWAFAFGAMAVAGGVMSGKGVAEQIKNIDKINDEIGIRNELNDMNIEATDSYTEGLDNFDASLGVVDNMVHEKPTDDMEVEYADTIEDLTPVGYKLPNGEEDPKAKKPEQTV